MYFSDFKVGTRLGFGFVLLLVAIIVVGGVGLMRLSQLDQMVDPASRKWIGTRRG